MRISAAGRILLYGIAILGLVPKPLFAQDKCQSYATARTEFGSDWNPNFFVSTNFPRTDFLPGPDTRYVMLRLKPVVVETDWQLTIRDGNDRVLQVLSPADFNNAVTAGVWTQRLAVDQANSTMGFVVDLRVREPTKKVKIEATAAIRMPAEGAGKKTRYSLQDPTAAKYASLYATGSDPHRSWGDRVGMLAGRGLNAAAKKTTWCCSGIYLGKNLFLTNWHCGAAIDPTGGAAWTAESCASTVVDLSWDEDAVGREFACESILASDEGLDYALLQLRPLAGRYDIAGALLPLPVAMKKAQTGENLVVIHHPECKVKQITTQCSVVDQIRESWRPTLTQATQSEFTHRCDSEGGSSGAPMFNTAGVLIGLHHLGFENTAGGCDKKNKAVHISTIITHLQQAFPAAYETLKDAIVLNE